jgi:hypothetical protein
MISSELGNELSDALSATITTGCPILGSPIVTDCSDNSVKHFNFIPYHQPQVTLRRCVRSLFLRRFVF